MYVDRHDNSTICILSESMLLEPADACACVYMRMHLLAVRKAMSTTTELVLAEIKPTASSAVYR